MANSTDLSTGLTAIFGSVPTAAQVAPFQAICDTDGIDAAFSSAADSGFASSARSVISFYQVFYGRQPDAAGLEFWTGQLESGSVSLNDLADDFATASEFNERFGDRTPTEVVFAQYRNVLGREPDFEGLTFWTNQVASGNLSLADLGRFFATADETEARFDPFIDAFLINAANGEQDFDQGLTLFEETLGNGTGVITPVTGAPISLAGQTGPVNGGAGADLFTAESGDLTSSGNINGGGGNDTLTVFNDAQTAAAISPRMQGVETVVWTEQTNDRNSVADNNVGGYSDSVNDVEVDVELDAGRINGVTRWEDYDSRADLVIEDIRDGDDVDGTFTGDLTIAMVSTDPGNVDYATYFDQPVNVSTTDDSIFIQVIDQNNSRAFTASDVTNQQIGSLEDARLDDFAFILNGERVDVVLDRTDPDVGTGFFGANATYTNLLNSINAALDNAVLADGTAVSSLVTASFGGVFVENIGNDNVGAGANSQVFGRQIVIDAQPGATATLADAGIGNDFTVTQLGEPADIAASVRAETVRNDQLIRLNIDLDDVGKGSMGGDLLAGAMSTGRQFGDDGTSDSQGIQQFDIRVDRSSQLQTINSTNNALEVVTIVNGENAGPNNTTTASDEQTGSLVVRGQANPNQFRSNDGDFDSVIATDNAMPGAVPQHDGFGFNDVRIIDASTMVGRVDLTLDLGNQIVEKYLNNADPAVGGDIDDVPFTYNLGTNNDEFLVNMAADALLDAGTASREDFSITVNGNGGDDSITTNVGFANKQVDGQGQDYYDLFEQGRWYANQANNDAATIEVTGGAGNDTIWTNGWGDAAISGGTGIDTVYTDNSGTETETNTSFPDFVDTFPFLTRGSRIENEQIDYQVGAVWTFNDDNGTDGNVSNISGSTNNGVALSAPAANTFYTTSLTVSFFGANNTASDATAYTSTVVIPETALNINATSRVISDQEMIQAIKRAVNNDPVLNKVLEAVDGPGQSLAVYSKIDGSFVSDDLSLNLFETQRVGAAAPTNNAVSLAGSSYDTSGPFAASDFQNFGRDSVAESDNVITITADGANDVTVLSTNILDLDGDDDNALSTFDNDVDNTTGVLNGASNEVLRVEEGSFGTETIFNFGASDGTANDGAEDQFDFLAIDFDVTAVNSFSNGSLAGGIDDTISILREDASNDTIAEIQAFYAAPNTTAREHIVIVYDDRTNGFDTTDNTGTVYLVTNPVGAGASVTEQGEINLIGTQWSDLGGDNFL